MSKRRTALIAVLGLIAAAGIFMAIAATSPIKAAARRPTIRGRFSRLGC